MRRDECNASVPDRRFVPIAGATVVAAETVGRPHGTTRFARLPGRREDPRKGGFAKAEVRADPALDAAHDGSR